MWHVDDLKISHVDEHVVTSIIDSLDKKYGEIMPVSRSRGRVHDYLGMTFDFSSIGEVKIIMYDYVSDLIKNVPQHYMESAGAATPAPDHLYLVRDPSDDAVQLLNAKRREQYHSLTAQCLCLSKRGRPDLQTSIAFHCTRVRNPDKDDEKKLGRTVRYLNKTKHLPLILSVDDSNVIT